MLPSELFILQYFAVITFIKRLYINENCICYIDSKIVSYSSWRPIVLNISSSGASKKKTIINNDHIDKLEKIPFKEFLQKSEGANL